jgi:two-component system chemotaxis response regulator CheB
MRPTRGVPVLRHAIAAVGATGSGTRSATPRPFGTVNAPTRLAIEPERRAPTPALGKLAGLVIIGVSTGGPRTLEEILPGLPADFPWAVLIAQHMPSNFTDAFARRMDALCRLTVHECNNTLPLEAGHAYVGQGGTDMVVVERLGRLAVQPRPEAPDHPWHPSVDVLVDSAMKLLAPERIVGVQLTGMGNDGARAMARLKAQGGRTIAESEQTAVVFGMPQELIELGGASLVLPCGDVTRQLCHWIHKKH